MNKEEFIKSLTKLNIEYTTDMLNKVEEYIDYLIEYNNHTNITAIKDINDIYLKHFYDSLTLVKVINFKDVNTLVDIGSGAGFPGMVLKIFFPHLNIFLIDSNNKKTTFLKNLVAKLQLNNISIINDRVENFAKNNLNKYDVVTARAVSNMRVLSELSLPLVKNHGFFVAMKGNAKEELDEALNTINLMGAQIIKTEIFNLPDSGNRTLIKIEKIRNTLIKELRPYEKIIKKPLQKMAK